MILSIIVPVYNVEAYLRKCVDSLLEQDLQSGEYEIILIDDGSTDKSGQLCDLLASNYNNIIVIHQKNKGLGAARNTGILAASGKYIQFVDSDDYLCPNVLRGLSDQLKNQELDILRINYQNVDSSGIVFEPNKYSKLFDDYSEVVCDGSSFLNNRLGYACYAVQFIIKSSLLKHVGNGFKEGIYYEDTEWVPRIIPQAKRIASSRTIVYNYLYRLGSITRNASIDKKRKSIDDRLLLIRLLQESSYNVPDHRWFDGMIAQTALSILYEVGRFFYTSRKQFLQNLIDLQIFPLSTFHTTTSSLRKVNMANISPGLLCLFYHLNNGK